MVEEGVDQGAVEIARRRVDDHPGRLVDHDQMRVLEHDVKSDVLRRAPRDYGGGQADPIVPGQRLFGGIAHIGPRPPDRAGQDQRLQPFAR